MRDGRAGAAKLDLRRAGAIGCHNNLFSYWSNRELDFAHVERRVHLSCLESSELNFDNATCRAFLRKRETPLLVGENAGDL